MDKLNEITSESGAKLRVPDYEGNSIAQIPRFAHAVLNQSANSPLHKLSSDKNVDLNGIKNIVFFLVDGFGYAQWKKYADKLEVLRLFESNGFVCPIDTVFPSSTPVALTTLQSDGRLPASHGLVDWWLYMQEIDDIIATLPFTVMSNEERDSLLKSSLSPKVLYKGKTLYESFADEDVDSYVFLHQDYAYSAYSNLMYKGAKMIPHDGIPTLFSNLEKQLGEIQKPSFSYVYWGGIDTTGHYLGLNSQEYSLAVNSFFDAMQLFIDSSKKNWPGNTLFIISADHGQVKVDLETTIFLDEIPGFNELLRISKNGKPIMPWGGPREVFVAVQHEYVQESLSLLKSKLGDKVDLVKSLDAFKAGLFGKVNKPHPDLFSRIGDIIVIPKGNYSVWYHHPSEKQFNFKAHHGGLSDKELQIPFAILRSEDA